MDSKTVFFSVTLLVIFTIIYSMYNNEALVLKTNASIGSSEASHLNTKKQKNTLVSSSLKMSKESFYKKFTFEQKINIKSRCEEYFYTNENGIKLDERYIEMYKNNHNNNAPSQKQLNALKRLMDKCHSFDDLQSELDSDFDSQELNLPNEQNKQYYIDLSKSNGKEVAIDDAQYNLLSLDERNRHSAKMFLHESGWLKSLNSELNIDGLEYNDAFGIFDTALEIRMCELGMVDCSSDSFTMLVSCQNLPETCGMDLINTMLFTLTGYEITLIEKYLVYLRSFNK